MSSFGDRDRVAAHRVEQPAQVLRARSTCTGSSCPLPSRPGRCPAAATPGTRARSGSCPSASRAARYPVAGLKRWRQFAARCRNVAAVGIVAERVGELRDRVVVDRVLERLRAADRVVERRACRAGRPGSNPAAGTRRGPGARRPSRVRCPTVVAPFTIARSAACASKSRAPNAYASARIGSAESPFISRGLDIGERPASAATRSARRRRAASASSSPRLRRGDHRERAGSPIGRRPTPRSSRTASYPSATCVRPSKPGYCPLASLNTFGCSSER